MKAPNLQELIDNINLSLHLDNTPYGVIIMDQNMQVVYRSKAAADIFACEDGHVQKKPLDLLQFVKGDEAPAVAASIAEITSGRVNHNEILIQNLTVDGNEIFCRWYNSALKNEAGNVVNILSLVQDVTAQVKTQLKLEKSQHQLSLAFNAAIDPMWLIQVGGPNQFWFETINIAFTKVTGWKPEQVEGQPIEKIMPEASHDLVRQKYNEAIRTGKIVDYVEEARHPSGIKYGEIRVIPIIGAGDEPIRILGIANDITEKVYLEKKLNNEREIRSRQITSAAIKGQESERAKVSRELHDNVNQVLTTVKLYIELCLDQKIDTETILRKCIVHLSNTINEIRNLSKRLSAPSLGNMNFKETLTDLAESLRFSAQIAVETDLDALPFSELEDELHLTLYRVVQEQFTNITKYAQARHASIRLREDSSVLRLTISDDGVGFDLTQKRKGIGITNMKSRVEILNGRFQIFSSPGKGTRVEIEIPIIIENNVCYAEQTVLNPLMGLN